MATTGDRILLGTRKGLVEARKTNGAWTLTEPKLPGQPIAYAMHDARNGSIWASIDHGHWGGKLARSEDDGTTYEEVEPPKYPESAGASENGLETTTVFSAAPVSPTADRDSFGGSCSRS